MKHTSRRSFVKTTSVTLGGLVSGIPTGVIGETPVPASANATAIASLSRIDRYTAHATICGASVASYRAGKRPPSTTIIAEISEPGALNRFYRETTSPIVVSGNECSFQSGEQFITIKNLTPDAHAEALRSLESGENNFFSHEALTSPVTSATAGSAQVYKISPLPNRQPTSSNAADAFASWFDTLIAAETHGLVISDEANHCGDVTCRFSGQTGSNASQVADCVIERIAYAAEVLDHETLRSLLSTRFVDESFRSANRISTARIASEFLSVRRKLSGHSVSSVWLALLVGSVADGGAMHRALTSSNALYASRTREALAGTMTILRSGSLDRLGFGSADISIQETETEPAEVPLQPSLLLAAGDLDGDGIPSLVEYAQGSDPLDPMSHPKPQLATEVEGEISYLTLTYNRNTSLTGVELIPQASSALNIDSWSTNGVEDRLLTTKGEIEIRQARIPITDNQKYMRILVRLK